MRRAGYPLRPCREPSDRHDAHAVAQLLRRDLRAWLEAATFRGERFGTPASFTGTAAGFRYRGLVERDGFPLHDLAEISVSVGGEITASVRVMSPFGELAEVRVSGPLLEGARGARVAYFGKVGSGAPQWHREWRGAGFPDLVRIEAERGDGRVWPMLVIGPGSGGRQREVSVAAPFRME